MFILLWPNGASYQGRVHRNAASAQVGVTELKLHSSPDTHISIFPLSVLTFFLLKTPLGQDVML